MPGKANFAAMLIGPKSKPDSGPPPYSAGPSSDPMESTEGEGAGMVMCPACGEALQLTAAGGGTGATDTPPPASQDGQ